MKALNVAIIASLFSLSAFAENPFQLSTGVTAAPIVTVPVSSACVVNGGNDEYGLCQASVMLGGTTLVTSAIVLLKEEMQDVKPDAVEFLAGGEMTLALQEVIQKLRDSDPELHNAADEVVASAIAQI